MREQLPCSRAHTAAELLMADCSSWSLCLAWAGSVLLACWARDGLQAPSPSGPCLLPGPFFNFYILKKIKLQKYI